MSRVATIHIVPPPDILECFEQFVEVNVRLDQLKEIRKKMDEQRRAEIVEEKRLKERHKELKGRLEPYYIDNIDYVHISEYGKVEGAIREKHIAPTPEEVSALAQREMKKLLREKRKKKDNVGTREDLSERANEITAELWDNEERYERAVTIKFVRKKPPKSKQPRKPRAPAKRASRAVQHYEEEEDDEEEEERDVDEEDVPEQVVEDEEDAEEAEEEGRERKHDLAYRKQTRPGQDVDDNGGNDDDLLEEAAPKRVKRASEKARKKKGKKRAEEPEPAPEPVEELMDDDVEANDVPADGDEAGGADNVEAPPAGDADI